MVRKQIAVLMNGTLLMSGVAAVLAEQANLSVSIIAGGDGDLVDKLSSLNPDALVLDGEDDALASRYPLGSLLRDCPDLVIIAVTIQESTIRTYRQQRVVSANAAAILDIISGLGGHR